MKPKEALTQAVQTTISEFFVDNAIHQTVRTTVLGKTLAQKLLGKTYQLTVGGLAVELRTGGWTELFGTQASKYLESTLQNCFMQGKYHKHVWLESDREIVDLSARHYSHWLKERGLTSKHNFPARLWHSRQRLKGVRLTPTSNSSAVAQHLEQRVLAEPGFQSVLVERAITRFNQLLSSPPRPVSTAPCIDDLNEPARVGQFYSVPCFPWSLGAWGGILPVSSICHNEKAYPWAERSNQVNHYHFDARFLSDEDINYLLQFCSSVLYPPSVQVTLDLLYQDFPIDSSKGNLTYYVLQCQREQPDHPGVPSIAMEPYFADVKLNCSKCPHQGFPLDTKQVDAEGCVICPGHGLKWNRRSGLLVPRFTFT